MNKKDAKDMSDNELIDSAGRAFVSAIILKQLKKYNNVEMSDNFIQETSEIIAQAMAIIVREEFETLGKLANDAAKEVVEKIKDDNRN